MNCYNCKAKEHCLEVVQPGSAICMINLLQYGGTHMDNPPRCKAGMFCSYCGKPLQVIGKARFCNNVNCTNRYVNI